jgi:SAM-dependent methyltransferase
MSAPDSSGLGAAYEGLESQFTDPAAVAAYREAMLARSRPQAGLLAALLDREQAVLEVGCGNGRLLIELSRRGAVAKAHGIDLARSRIEFAQAWAQDEAASGLSFAAGDALELEPAVASLGALLCITGAFAYFEPLATGTAARLLAAWHRALAPGGLLCLELYPHPEYVTLLRATGGHARVWHELGPEDPWRFYLSELRLDPDTGVLTHDKTFVHRASGAIDEGRRERLMLYSDEQLRALLADAGFVDVELREGWSEAPYDGGEVMVVLARRSAQSS